jgi:hypothetical protein
VKRTQLWTLTPTWILHRPEASARLESMGRASWGKDGGGGVDTELSRQGKGVASDVPLAPGVICK